MKFRPALILLVLFLVIVPTIALAQGGIPKAIVPDTCNGVGGCQSICDIAKLAQNVLNTGIYFAVFISAILFAYAGFQAATAAGNAEKYANAKSIFGNVVIGLIIILVGWLAVDTLMKTMTGEKLGPWNQVCKVGMVSPFDKFYA